ncbi:hypothetical protein DIPPA_01632 [Diplonema papillatum]|nr:hypothetical protein DIPPA_01632 [Diplonema papillatum]
MPGRKRTAHVLAVTAVEPQQAGDQAAADEGDQRERGGLSAGFGAGATWDGSCVYYMSGYCNQGSRCPHRHTAAEPPPRKKSRIEVRASRSTQYRTKAETLPGPKAALLRKTECSICLDIMSNPASRPVVRLECKHFFHRACFDEWLGFGDECPMCAAKLFKPL